MLFNDEQLAMLYQGDFRSLARTISLIENEAEGYELFLKKISSSAAKIIGVTGAPGAGKSSLVDALIAEIINDKKKVGILCIDPSSPFNKGALLGDRIRMSEWYNNPQVFIRSLSSKGSLGGLHPKIIEITDVMKAAGFDYIIIETVGVGQSEVDIAGLADVTLVVLVPEGGDVIQTMKAGLMEVADIFIINKYDRPGAENFFNNLQQMLAPVYRNTEKNIPILKTIASQKEGVHKLYTILSAWNFKKQNRQRTDMIAEKIWMIIAQQKMKKINRERFMRDVHEAISQPDFNLYRFAEKYY